MRFSRQLQTVAVLTAGAMLGYLAASGEPRTAARAETARIVSGNLSEKTANALRKVVVAKDGLTAPER